MVGVVVGRLDVVEVCFVLVDGGRVVSTFMFCGFEFDVSEVMGSTFELDVCFVEAMIGFISLLFCTMVAEFSQAGRMFQLGIA